MYDIDASNWFAEAKLLKLWELIARYSLALCLMFNESNAPYAYSWCVKKLLKDLFLNEDFDLSETYDWLLLKLFLFDLFCWKSACDFEYN